MCWSAGRQISPEPGWVLSVGRMGEVLCAGMGLSGRYLHESPSFNTQAICEISIYYPLSIRDPSGY